MPDKPKKTFLQLDDIEAEGRAAVEETAHEMLEGILKNGGRIDWSALARGGPQVARSLLRLTVEAAKQRPRQQTAPPSPQREKSDGKPRRVAPPPRVEKNWRELRTEDADYRWYAFLKGTTGAMIMSLIAFAIIRLLHF